MNGFRTTGTQLGELCSYPSILFASLFLLFIPSTLFAQSYSYAVTGENLSIEVSDEYSSPVSYVVISVIPPYDIDPESPFYVDWTGSWLCSGGNCSYSLSFDASSGELKVIIEATEARAGAGRMAFVKGIIIEPVDIEARIGFQEAKLVAYPNPANHRLLVKMSQGKLLKTRWISLDGKATSTLMPDPSGTSLDVSGFSPGIYEVIFETDAGEFHKRIAIN